MNRVSLLIGEACSTLAAEEAGPDDPSLTEVVDTLIGVMNMAGARLMEAQFGANFTASREVLGYMEHLERVRRTVTGAPIRIPTGGVRPVRVAAKLVETSDEFDEVVALVVGVHQVVDAAAQHTLRRGGAAAKPLEPVLDVAVRAGAVYRDSLELAIPLT